MAAAPLPPAGLCNRCLHQRVVRTARSVFSLCERAHDDDRFPKYPALPVIRCAGFTANGDADGR